MQRSITCTVAAAMLGSAITLWLTERGPQPAAAAPPVNKGRVSSASGPRIEAPPAGEVVLDSRLYNADGLTPDEVVGVAVYELANRGVVNISTVQERRGFFGAVPEPGSGSGSVLDKSGHLLTNYHVVEEARQMQVTLYNEENYDAELVGADPVNDVAVLKIDAPAEKLYPISLGDSAHLRVGMRVFALGNPFGLDRSMSVGVISSLNRSLEIRENWVIKSIIQIDASINPGNSGGPLLDAHGRLIGMNTAIATADAHQSAGIGFAIPINLIKRVVPELLEHGRVIRGDIGITHVTVVDDGLRIARLVPGGPAEAAGLRGPKVTRRGPVVIEDRSTADVIVEVDGEEVSTAAEFLGHIESKKPGDKVDVTVLRNGRRLTISVTLGGESLPSA